MDKTVASDHDGRHLATVGPDPEFDAAVLSAAEADTHAAQTSASDPAPRGGLALAALALVLIVAGAALFAWSIPIGGLLLLAGVGLSAAMARRVARFLHELTEMVH